jgi:predicted branched-subunit amino acid permease
MTATAIRATPVDTSGTRAGLVAIVPVALGILPFATMVGVAISESSVSDVVGYIGGLLVAGGSAQIAVVGSIDVGAGLLASVATAMLIQARGIVYGASLAPKLAGQPRWFRWLASYMLVDQMFALADAVDGRDHRWFRQFYVTAGVSLWIAYFGGVMAGMLMGPVIGEGSPLPMVIPMLFASLLGPTLRSVRSVAAAVVAVITSVVIGPFLPAGVGMVAAIVAGSGAGVVVGRMRRG